MASRLVLRFDIDTITCVKKGVPPLLEFADKYSLSLTFFANVGRAVSWSGVLRSRLGSSRVREEKARSLGAINKLGWGDLARTVLLDPEVGSVGRAELRAIEARGHDLGLHGGRNHSAWHHGAKKWSEAKLRGEVQWGINRMAQLGLQKPKFFASPGFTHPERLPKVLKELDFTVIADDHGWAVPALRKEHKKCAPLRVSTGILGEPGGVGFLEHVVATGRFDEAEISDLLKEFIESNETFVLYDHPCFAGGRGLFVLEAIVKCWENLGGEFCSMSELMH